MAPHQGRTGVPVGAPNAALLIDFDNVTMGIRSDLTRQLKDLLNSDIIKGKVAVQRAYADWRRYAQYIVPLSEASVDLIFAPAYGSSKKNATDIRLAIDALELVFTRPEIGVFILLSGDSDFSSLVLKLKEYGKYVIGVGLRESASDLLVQNCDEYYSYSSLTGLTRAGEEEVVSAVNPWDLAERAVQQMAQQNDVMRSDRLKQVMLELDPSFDEGQLGYSKFNRFITEAASRNKLGLKKLDNGQYEVQPFADGEREAKEERRRGRGRGRGEARREGRRAERVAAEPASAAQPEREPRQEAPAREPQKPAPRPRTRERRAEDLDRAYDLLRRAVSALAEPGEAARDSDVKRQMLELEPKWDESEIGFTKFSRFLRQAHDAEVIDLQKSQEGYYEARLPRGAGSAEARPSERDTARGRGREERGEPRARGRDRDRDRGRRGRGRDEQPQEAERGEPVAEPVVEAAAASGGPAPEAAEAEEPAVEREARPGAAEMEPQPPAGEPAEGAAEPTEAAVTGPAASHRAPAAGAAGRAVGRGRRGRRGTADGPPPLLPGQVVGAGSKGGDGAKSAPPAAPDPGVDAAVEAAASGPVAEREAEPTAAGKAEPTAARGTERAAPAGEETGMPGSRRDQPAGEPERAEAEGTQPIPAPGAGADFDATELGLPTESGAVIRYLSNSYQGVGQKTAETLIGAFGADRVFHGLHSQPERVREVLGSGRRTETLLEAWQKDFRRRTTAGAAGSPSAGEGGGPA